MVAIAKRRPAWLRFPAWASALWSFLIRKWWPWSAARNKKFKGEMIDLYLFGAKTQRIQVPLEEASQHLGVTGYHVRDSMPYRWIVTLPMAVVFATMAGYYSLIVFKGWGQVAPWAMAGGVVGVIAGMIFGSMLQKTMFKHFYIAWSSWDATKKVRSVTPMEHHSTLDLMEKPTPEHRAAFLARVGELPTRRKPMSSFDADGQEPEEEAVVDSAATAHVVATYSPKGLYVLMKGVIFHRVLTMKRSSERMIQIASIGTIAVGMIVIASLVVLVFTSEQKQERLPATTAETPAASQGVSNARR